MDEIKKELVAVSYSDLSSVDKKILVSLVCCMIFFAIAALIFGFAPLMTIPALIFAIVGTGFGVCCIYFLTKINNKKN